MSTKKPYGEASKNGLYTDYKRYSRRRGIAFLLDRDEFYHLTNQNCSYCGRPPSQLIRKDGCNGGHKYTGLDRENNEVGYIPGNVIPCCWPCNNAKGTMTKEEFLGLITDIYNHSINSRIQ